MSSFEVIIQHHWYPYKKGKSGHRESHTHTVRIQSEVDGIDQDDALISQEMPKTASKPAEPRRGRKQILPHNPQKEPTLLTP